MSQSSKTFRALKSIFIGIVIVVSIVQSGCRSNYWNGPTFAQPVHLRRRTSNFVFADVAAVYSKAGELEAAEDEGCVDLYFEAAVLALPAIRESFGCVDSNSVRVLKLYHSALAKTISTGQTYCRFDPIAGLKIVDQHGSRRIPFHYHGFVWQPDDFNELILVGDYRNSKLLHAYRCSGLGVPLVVKRKRPDHEILRKREQTFSATVILKQTSDNAPEAGLAFDFYDPLRIKDTHLGSDVVGISRDLTAPYAYMLDTSKNFLDLDAFRLYGSRLNAAGLFSIEPYQRGKIPLIFVHGLISDPTTWAPMVNELRARPDLMDQYQIWGFEYQTGASFVDSARILREQLAVAVETIDPEGTDSALSQIVMVGHSMGGLLTQLQITYSESRIWDSISNRPLDQIVASEDLKDDLAKYAFFSPSPAIKRVVFIGTPHRGALMAQQLCGKIGALLVKQPDTRKEEHRALLRDNPGVFSEEVQKRIPTSIDLLKPESGVLQAIESLTIAPDVAMHTIYGDTGRVIREPSDTVVPVTSARHKDVVSELMLRAKHTELHRKPESIKEIVAILKLHLRTIENKSAPVTEQHCP